MGKDKYEIMKENARAIQAMGFTLTPSQASFLENLEAARKEQKKLVQLKRRRWP